MKKYKHPLFKQNDEIYYFSTTLNRYLKASSTFNTKANMIIDIAKDVIIGTLHINDLYLDVIYQTDTYYYCLYDKIISMVIPKNKNNHKMLTFIPDFSNDNLNYIDNL